MSGGISSPTPDDADLGDESPADRLGPVTTLLSEPPVVRLQRELEALIDVARAVNSSLDIDALLPNLMQRTTQLMKVERASVWLLDEERSVVVNRWTAGSRPGASETPLHASLPGWVTRHGQPVTLNDPGADPRFDRRADEAGSVPTRSIVCAPVRDKSGRVLGAVECLNKKSRGFDAEDELLLSCIAVQCAVALENGALYASLRDKNRALEGAETQLRRVNAELEVLYAIEQQIASAPDVASLVGSVLERIANLSQAAAAAVLLATESSGQVFSSQRGQALPQRELDPRETQRRLSQARFPQRRAAQAGEPEPEALVSLPERIAIKTFSAPLSDGRSQIGILQVVRAADSSGDDETVLGQLALVAGQLGRGIVLRRDRDAGERAQRLAMLGHSLGGILHDMRTPLSAVGGYIELMAAEDSASVRRDYAARVERALENMENMTQEVLAFARGQREVLVRKVYLDRFIEEVREMLVAELSRFGVNLEIKAEHTGAARFDESKLKRVLWNLARNAAEAMGEGGTFRWTIAQTAERLIFECSDTGPGIPKAMEGRLFESFATHGKAGGTGLGLAMARKIVDAHCGSIQVSSPPGQGATFRIEIPN